MYANKLRHIVKCRSVMPKSIFKSETLLFFCSVAIPSSSSLLFFIYFAMILYLNVEEKKKKKNKFLRTNEEEEEEEEEVVACCAYDCQNPRQHTRKKRKIFEFNSFTVLIPFEKYL